MLDRFNAGHQCEPVVAERERLSIEIDNLDFLAGDLHQPVGVIARERAQWKIRGEETKQVAGAAADVEVIAMQLITQRAFHCRKHSAMSQRCA